jgi:hypothetical protein
MGPRVAGTRAGALARVLAQADLVLLALALPLFLVADWPLVGYAVAAAVWLAQRFARAAVERRIARAGSPRAVAALTAATIVAPIWLMALAVLIVGLAAGADDGLAAGLVMLVLFSVNLPARLMARRAPGTTP